MRKTNEELEQEKREAEALRKAREEWDFNLVESTADILGKAVHGAKYTNPQLTASLGLSGVEVNTQAVHQLNANKLRQEFKYAPSLESRFDLDKNDPIIYWSSSQRPMKFSKLLQMPEIQKMDPEFAFSALNMVYENPSIGIENAFREDETSEKMFYERYEEIKTSVDPLDPDTYKQINKGNIREYRGKFYKIKPGQSPAAVPGASWHQYGKAIDYMNDTKLAAQLKEEYGLRQVTSTNETWHFQPEGVPDGFRVLAFMQNRYGLDVLNNELPKAALDYINDNFSSNSPYHPEQILENMDKLVGYKPINKKYGTIENPIIEDVGVMPTFLGVNPAGGQNFATPEKQSGVQPEEKDFETTAGLGMSPGGKTPSKKKPVFQQNPVFDYAIAAQEVVKQIRANGESEYGLPDLFAYEKMKAKSLMSRMQLPQDDPDWVNIVDPDGVWRNTKIPAKVNDARELLEMDEVQVIKILLSNGWEEWNKIPGINERSLYKDGKELKPSTSDSQRGLTAGNFEMIRRKFPTVSRMWDMFIQMEEQQNQPSFMQAATAELGMVTQAVKTAFNVPKSIISFLAPDTIGIPGVASIGPVPLRIDLEKGGDLAIGTARAASVGFVSAAQFGKNLIEWRMTTPSVGGPYMVTTIPVYNDESLENFKKLVFEGNVITQIAKQALKDPSEIDLGRGFFPEGEIMRRAIEAHDAGLPKLSGGQTWTFGQSLIEPFVKEGYIDRDGWMASVFSGIADATFTVGTDIGVWVDPVKALMKTFNLTMKGATTVITNGRQVDIIRDAWAAERRAKGLPTVIQEPIEMVFNPQTGTWMRGIPTEADDIPRFAGMLPPGSQLPDEAEAVARELADQAVAGKDLATLDSPPSPVPYRPPSNTLAGYKQNLGIVDDGTGVLRINPLDIDNMPNYADGRRALNKLTSFKNVGELWDSFIGNIPIGVAVQIQDYVDEARRLGQEPDIKEVHKILVDGVLTGDPLYGVATTPGVMKQYVNQTGKSIAQFGSGFTRQMASMPGSTFFSFNDPLSSIKDMNNLMIVMKIPKAKRHETLARAMNAVVKEGPKARMELANDFMDAIVGTKLRQQGVPEEWVKIVTSYAGWSDGVHQWTMDMIGQGYYLPWLEDGSGDMLRMVDFLNYGFLMMAPENMKQVIRETTNLLKLVKPVRGNPKIESIINQQITTKLEEIQKGYLKPIALGAPLPLRLITRVVIIDEILRSLLTGEFGVNSMRSMVASGHINYDTHGVVIRSVKEIEKRAAILDEIDILYKELSDAKKNKLVDRINEIQKSINKIEKKYGNRQQINAEIKLFNERAVTDLPGANRKLAKQTTGLGGDDLRDPRYIRYERSNITETVFRDTQPDLWVTATSRDLVRMSLDEVYQVVAKVLLGGNKDEILDLPNRFLNGDLRPIFDKYRKGLKNENPAYPLTNPSATNEWVGTMILDISTRTVMDPVLMGVVATGRIGKTTVLKNNVTDLWDAKPELKEYVRNNLLNNPNAPLPAPFHRTTASAQAAEKERWLTKNFKYYRNVSQRYARNPLHQQKKWRRIIELMPIMDPDEARAMVASLEKSNAPDYLVDEIKANVKYAEGTATRKQVELLGDMHGAQAVDNVMFNFENQSFFANRHVLTLSFFDAYREQWSFWLRQMLTNPSVLEKARLAKEGAVNTQIPAWAGGDPNRGILFKDEDTGQQMVALPFTRQVYSMLGLNAEERIATRNLTLLGQAVPGFFGIGGMIMNGVLPDTQLFNGIRNVMFPYGNPATKDSIADYIAAPWLQGFAGSALEKLGETEFGKNFGLVGIMQQLLTSEMSDTMRQTTLNAVLTNIAANADGLPVTGKQREKLVEDANKKADSLIIFKSILRIFTPANPMTKYFVDAGSENVTAGAVLDDFRKFTAEAETFSEGVTRLLDKYGDSAWIFLSGATKAAPGMQPTKEYAEWFRDNKSIVDKYPEIGGYLGPQEGEFDPGAYSEQRTAGYREPADIKERQNKALNNVAWAIYNNKKKQITNEAMMNGIPFEQVSKLPVYKREMKIISDQIKKQFPLWNPRVAAGQAEETLVAQLEEISRMVDDKKVVSTEIGSAIKEYWDHRNRNILKATTKDPSLLNDAWRTSTTSNQAFDLRNNLFQKGSYLAQKTPGFSVIWESILSREFDPPEAR
jgi:hypothetical protein